MTRNLAIEDLLLSIHSLLGALGRGGGERAREARAGGPPEAKAEVWNGARD